LLHALRRCWLSAGTVALVGAALAASAAWMRVPSRHSAEAALALHPPPALRSDLAHFADAQVRLLQDPVVRARALEHSAHPTAVLETALHIDFPQPDVMRLRIDSDRPDEPEALLRAVVDAYLQTTAERRQDHRYRLQTTWQQKDEELKSRRALLARWSQPRLALAGNELVQVRSDLRQARLDLVGLRTREQELDRLQVSEHDLDESLKKDPSCREDRHELDRTEKEIERTRRISALGDQEPTLQPLLRRYDGLRDHLEKRRQELLRILEDQLRARVGAELATKLAEGRARIQELEDQEKALQAEIAKLGGLPSAEEARALRDEVAARAEAQEKLAAEVRAAEGEEMAGPPVVWQGEGATLRGNDHRFRMGAVALAAGAVALLLLFTAAQREVNRRIVAAAADVSEGLGLAVVGTLPFGSENARASSQAATAFQEAADAIRTVLLRPGERPPRVVMIASAVRGEGRSTLAAALAASLARAWHRTVLIDGDSRRPALHRRRGLPLEPGLCEVLRGESDLDDALQATSEGRLWLLAAGHWDQHAQQALAREGTAALLQQLAERYDCIILDVPPLLEAADALVFSQHADAVLLAVRCEYSALPAIHAAQQRLAALKAPLVGAVLLGAPAP
jgi:capsular exopolysaccharide synthesis family protein